MRSFIGLKSGLVGRKETAKEQQPSTPGMMLGQGRGPNNSLIPKILVGLGRKEGERSRKVVRSIFSLRRKWKVGFREGTRGRTQGKLGRE